MAATVCGGAEPAAPAGVAHLRERTGRSLGDRNCSGAAASASRPATRTRQRPEVSASGETRAALRAHGSARQPVPRCPPGRATLHRRAGCRFAPAPSSARTGALRGGMAVGRPRPDHPRGCGDGPAYPRGRRYGRDVIQPITRLACRHAALLVGGWHRAVAGLAPASRSTHRAGPAPAGRRAPQCSTAASRARRNLPMRP
jgi:hypothetical protein